MDLLKLPDELIMKILSYLDSYSNILISETCHRLDEIVCEKTIVKRINLCNQYNLTSTNIKHFFKPRFRCLNITTLNIEGCFTIPRSILIPAIRKLKNLKNLYALNTRLGLQDIVTLSNKLEHLTDVSVMWDEVKNTSSLYLLIMKMQMLYLYNGNCKKPSNNGAERFVSIEELISFKKWKYSKITNVFFIGLDRPTVSLGHEIDIYKREWNPKLDISKYYARYLPGMFDRTNNPEVSLAMRTIEEFLPGFCIDANTIFDPETNFFDDEIQYRLGFEEIDPRSITSLKLRQVAYNYTNRSLKNSTFFINIRKISADFRIFCVIDDHLEQDINKKCNGKRKRNGILTEAPQCIVQAMDVIAEACPKLEELEIFKDYDVTGTGEKSHWYPQTLRSIAKFKCLQSLTLSGLAVVDGRFFLEIAQGCTNLRTLIIHNLGNLHVICVYIKELLNVIRFFEHLEEFSLIQQRIGDIKYIFEQLASCPKLLRVYLRTGSNIKSCGLESVLVNLIDKCPSLITLALNDFSLSQITTQKLIGVLNRMYRVSRPTLSIMINAADSTCSCPNCTGYLPNILNCLFLNSTYLGYRLNLE